MLYGVIINKLKCLRYKDDNVEFLCPGKPQISQTSYVEEVFLDISSTNPCDNSIHHFRIVTSRLELFV